MLTATDHALRRTGITSTDVTRIVGESPWGGPCDVFAEKISEEAPREPTLYQRIGHTLEPLVLDLIAEQFGVKLTKSPTIAHATMPWVLATPDGVGVDCVGEAKVKSVSFQRANEWDDDDTPPAFVVVQTQWHMITKAVERCFVGALLGAKPKFYVVEHDPDLADVLLNEAERFYRQHIVHRIPPPVDGSDGAKKMLAKLWPKANGNTVKAGRHADQLAADYFAAHRALKEAEGSKELAAQRLKEVIGAHEGITGDGWRATLKERAAVTVAAHTKQPYRHFDIRPVKGS